MRDVKELRSGSVPDRALFERSSVVKAPFNPLEAAPIAFPACVSPWPLTTSDLSEGSVKRELGRDWPNWGLFTSWRELRFVEDANSVSGNGPVSAVDCRRTLSNDGIVKNEAVVEFPPLLEIKADPAGTFPSPVRLKVFSPTKPEAMLAGIAAGTPGNTSVRLVTRPVVSHWIPLHDPHGLASFSHPTACSDEVFDVARTMSPRAQNWRAAPWPVTPISEEDVEKSFGIVCKMGGTG